MTKQPTKNAYNDVAACTCANLRRTTRAVTQLFDGVLQPAGITSTQFTLLAALSHLGQTPVGELAERLGMDRTSLTRTLRPLESANYIRNARGPDRRVRHLTMTPTGTRKLGEALPLWRSAQRQMVRRLGNDRWADLLQHLSAAEAAADS